MTACPSAYVLKLICGSERGRVEREISAFERQGRPTPLSVSSGPNLPRIPSNPPFLRMARSSPLALCCFFILFRLSDCCQLTNEKGEDDTRSHKMNDPQLESEEGKRRGGKKPAGALNCSPSCKKVKLMFRCSTTVLCLRVLFYACVLDTLTHTSCWSVTGGQTPAWRCADHTLLTAD